MKYFINDWENDCFILQSYLDQVEFYSGSDRRRNQFAKVKHTKGTGSMLYGSTWKSFLKYNINKEKVYRTPSKVFKGQWNTKCVDMYPELDLIFREFGELYFPEFAWSQVQMNKNYQCPPHFDSQNIGESILLTLGEFTEGKTIVELGDNAHVHYNSHYRLCKFDGSKYKHWTQPFEGTRYALVFFNNSKLIKI